MLGAALPGWSLYINQLLFSVSHILQAETSVLFITHIFKGRRNILARSCPVRTTPLPNTEIEPPATLPQEGYCCQPDTHRKARHCRASAVNWLEAIDQGSATVCGHWGQVLNRASRSTRQDLTLDVTRPKEEDAGNRRLADSGFYPKN